MIRRLEPVCSDGRDRYGETKHSCFDSAGTCIWPGIDGQMPWLCEVNGLTVKRMSIPEAEAAGCPFE